MSANRLPLVPSTVTINGSVYGPRSTIWAGLRWSEAVFRQHSLVADDPHLSVPFCHIDDDMLSEKCGWYRIRPRQEGWGFVRAPNGAWVLRPTPAPATTDHSPPTPSAPDA